jgi:hypothetical protein
MRFDPQAGIVKPKSAPTRRRHGRLPQETLKCNVGEILDLSAGGMRVLTRRVPAEAVKVRIEGYEFPGELIAEVAWTKRLSMFKREVGFRFLSISPEVAQVLTSIAAVNRFRRAI